MQRKAGFALLTHNLQIKLTGWIRKDNEKNCFYSLIGVVLFFVSFEAEQVHAGGVSAKTAIACTHSSECTYFADVYNGDASFRKVLLGSLKKAGIRRTKWLYGPSSLMIPVNLEGKSRLLGGICESHICVHGINVLYLPKNNSIVGLYTLDDCSPVKWFGTPTKQEKMMLRDASNPHAAISAFFTSSSVSFPVRAWCSNKINLNQPPQPVWPYESVSGCKEPLPKCIITSY